MPVREFVWDGSSWGDDNNVISRDDLVPGTYIPGMTPNTVGVVDWPAVTNVEVGTVQLSMAFQLFIPTSTYYENTRFECPVFTGVASPSTMTFYNCHFVGLNPQVVQDLYDTLGEVTSVGDSSRGFINYRNKHVTFIDCTFDNGWWFDQGLSNRISTLWSGGLTGGNFTLTRCEVTRFVDGVGWAQGPCGIDAFTLIQDSWIHRGFYANGIVGIPGKWNPQSGGYTHSDAFQVNTGRNCEIKFSMLGGERRDTAVSESIPYLPGGDTGGDFGNSIFMWQQEVNNYTTAGDVAYMNVHDNWMGGGMGTIQAVVKNGNDLSNNCFVTNNKVWIRRPGWGQGGSAGYWFVQSVGGTGIVYTNNVQWDGTITNMNGNGVAVPITNAL